MGKGAIWIGAVFIIFGIWLLFKILSSDTPLFVLIYPIGCIVIGIALIILYKEEDKIAEMKIQELQGKNLPKGLKE